MGGDIFKQSFARVFYDHISDCCDFFIDNLEVLWLGLAHLLLAGNDTWRGGGMRPTECPLVATTIERVEMLGTGGAHACWSLGRRTSRH